MLKKILNKNFIYFIVFIFIASCSSVPKYPQNACKIFGEKYSYLKYSRAASKKWNVPISSILAVINKESGFRRFAKPKRTKIFKIIPYRRPSSSLGFSQAVNKTWDLYKKENNKPIALNDTMIEDANIIINMGCMENDFCPAIFVDKIDDWRLENPSNGSIEEFRETRERIKSKVDELIEKINNAPNGI